MRTSLGSASVETTRAIGPFLCFHARENSRRISLIRFASPRFRRTSFNRLTFSLVSAPDRPSNTRTITSAYIFTLLCIPFFKKIHYFFRRARLIFFGHAPRKHFLRHKHG